MLENYYKDSIQKINFKNYLINNEIIHQQLEIIDQILMIGKENNLKFVLGGLWGLIFIYKKIYRTPIDVDIVVQQKDIINWLKLIGSLNTYNLIYSGNPINFTNDFINGDRQLQGLFNNKLNQKVELMSVENISNLHELFPITNIEFNNYVLTVKDPFKIKYAYGRQKDKDDIEFYFGNVS